MLENLSNLIDTTDVDQWIADVTNEPSSGSSAVSVSVPAVAEASFNRIISHIKHAMGTLVEYIAGHADTEMTEHYLHVQESIRQSAIELFSEAFSA